MLSLSRIRADCTFNVYAGFFKPNFIRVSQYLDAWWNAYIDLCLSLLSFRSIKQSQPIGKVLLQRQFIHGFFFLWGGGRGRREGKKVGGEGSIRIIETLGHSAKGLFLGNVWASTHVRALFKHCVNLTRASAIRIFLTIPLFFKW